MDILYLLVPFSVLVVLALIAVFAWALQAGQFDDLDREGERILEDERALRAADDAPGTAPDLDIDQTGAQEGGRH